MSRPGHEELIQAEIDGVNSAAESARLQELLASRPDVDARFQSLKRASETLAGAERIAPPAGFADDVMRAVRRREPAREASTGWREALRSLLAPAPLAACAFILAVGVVLGGLLPTDSVFSRSERAALSGTTLTHGRLGASRTLDRKAIACEGVQGEAVTRIEGGLLLVDIDLEAMRPVDVRLDLAGTGLTPRSLSLDGPSGGDVVMARDAVRFIQPAGRLRTSLSFALAGPVGRSLPLRVGDGEAWNLSLGQEGRR